MTQRVSDGMLESLIIHFHEEVFEDIANQTVEYALLDLKEAREEIKNLEALRKFDKWQSSEKYQPKDTDLDKFEEEVSALRKLKLENQNLRAELSKVYSERWHASAFMECEEKLTYASQDLHDAEQKLKRYENALKEIAKEKTFVGRNDPLGMPIETPAARKAIKALEGGK